MKFVSIIRCRKLTNLLSNMLSNRLFQIYSDNDRSKVFKLNDGLPQGSVLAPLLFNLYIYDLPATSSRKFIYADDICLVTQSSSFTTAESTVTADMEILDTYFRKWCLRLNLLKTVISAFHLRNRYSNYKPEVKLRGQTLQYCSTPKYLGITLDRSLTFRQHLFNVAAKVKTRNNIIQKLAGTSWGCSAQTLRSTALALSYSVAEYCCPAWMNSVHSRKIDVQLNQTMRLITGCIRSTQTAWLPVLSNIQPPALRRSDALLKTWRNIHKNPQLPVHSDILIAEHQRLKSRKPPWRTAQHLEASNFNINEAWKSQWEDSSVVNGHLIENPSMRVPGFTLPRRQWRIINRIRTGQGNCGYLQHKWGWATSPDCDCGAALQTIIHIVGECPKRAFGGSINDIHRASPEGLNWINGLDLEI